jgi:hypothetical protein
MHTKAGFTTTLYHFVEQGLARYRGEDYMRFIWVAVDTLAVARDSE